VAGECNLRSELCLRQADHSAPRDEREVEVLSAVARLSAGVGLAHVAEVPGTVGLGSER
jgi:hypothetical protein